MKHAFLNGRSKRNILAIALLVSFVSVASSQIGPSVRSGDGLISCDGRTIIQFGLWPRSYTLPDSAVVETVYLNQGRFAIDTAGRVFAWGVWANNYFGDTSDLSLVEEPKLLYTKTRARQLASREEWALLILDEAGDVYGIDASADTDRNYFLGESVLPRSFEPRRIPLPKKVRQIDGMWGNCHALMEDGTVWTWGRNSGGRGVGFDTLWLAPAEIQGISRIKKITSGIAGPTFLVDSSGNLFAWGANTLGQVGDGTLTNRLLPVSLDLKNVVDIRCGARHTIALTADGSVWTWGFRTRFGVLGIDSLETSLVPVRVSGLPPVKAIYAGSITNLVIDIHGDWWGWGLNYGTAGLMIGMPLDTVTTPRRIRNPCSALSVIADHPALQPDASLISYGGVRLHARDNANTTVHIIDINGRIVYQGFRAATVDNVFVPLPAGVYFVVAGNSRQKVIVLD